MGESLLINAFRYTDLPPEIQAVILLKYVEDIRVELREVAKKNEPILILREKCVGGIKLCSYETIQPESPVKFFQTIRSSKDILSLLLVSRDFRLSVLKALKQHGSVWSYSPVSIPSGALCSTVEYESLYLSRKLSIDDVIGKAQVNYETNDLALKRKRFKSLNYIKLRPKLQFATRAAETMTKNLPLYSLEDLYYGRNDAKVFEWAAKDLDKVLYPANTSLEDLLDDGIMIRWRFKLCLDLWCDGCKDCPLDQREIIFSIVGARSGCLMLDCVIRERWLDEKDSISYEGEEPELLAMDRLLKAKEAGRLESWEDLKKSWTIDKIDY